MRVASLLPSATEIVCALGARDLLVARSAECDFPPSVCGLPVVMCARAPVAKQSSAEIDARVRAARRAGESLYGLDLDLLRRLRPDLILTQDLCGVCSVTEAEVFDACARAGIRPRVETLAPTRLEEVWESVLQVGRALGRVDESRSLVARLRTHGSDASAKHGTEAPRVAVVEWIDPPFLAGLWTPDVVVEAGGQPVGPHAGTPGYLTTWSRIADERPELVLIAPCSFPVDRTTTELNARELQRELARLRPSFGVWVADEAYFSRPGPRVADGIELIRSLLAERLPAAPMPLLEWTAGSAEALP